MRARQLRTSFGTHIPGAPEEGVLYISMDFATAVHLCACGCKSKVVTPLGPADWQLVFDGTVTLRPSIGNGQLLCRSHYHIRHDTIEWMRPISAEATRAARRRDQAALRQFQANATLKPSRWQRPLTHLRTIFGRGRRSE